MKHSVQFFACALLMLILAFAGCKEKVTVPEPFTMGIEKFSAAGIPDENISIKDNIIRIELPADYKSGDLIKPDIKTAKTYTVPAAISNGFSFEGRDISFKAVSSKYIHVPYQIIVISKKPIQLPANQKNYEIIIAPDAKISVPILLPGTVTTLDSAGNLSSGDVGVVVKSKTTGKIVSDYTTVLNRDSSGTNLNFTFTPTIPADTYEISVQWGAKTASVPNLLNVKHGQTKVYVGFAPLTTEERTLNIAGYNIYPSNRYEVIYENDFVGSKKQGLLWKDYNTLQWSIPADLPGGSYRITLLENGKALESSRQLFGRYADFYYLRNSQQPIIDVISTLSSKNTTEPVIDHYDHATRISRNEEILVAMAKLTADYAYDFQLLNRATKKVFTLKFSGLIVTVADGYQYFQGFKIPADLPAGEYEAYAILKRDPQIVSEKYPKILKIQ